jgi:glycosyltransferase involved in cell wall biosynthesis
MREMGLATVSIPALRLKRSARLKVLWEYWQTIREAREVLREFCRHQGARLIHSNSTTAHYVGGAVARSLRLPAIWHVRDLVDIPIGKKCLNKTATHIIAISEAVRLSLIRQGFPAEKISVIYNGVDVDHFQPREPDAALRRQYGVPENGFVFAMIGQLVPWKRHDLFLAAAAQIADSFPNVRFWIVGADLFGDHPDYCASLQRQAEEPPLSGRVSFLGMVEDMVRLLSCVDVVVLPSDHEPFGRVLIEAMAMGKPVIASRSGGPLEIVEDRHSGILVPPDNLDTLVEAMEQMLTRNLWREHAGLHARQHVCNHFNQAKTTTETCQLYEKLLRNT